MSVIGDGQLIGIRFTRPLIGDIDGYATPAGYVKTPIDLSNAEVTALNQYSTSYPIGNAIDGSTSTYWRGTTATNWIHFKLTEPKVVTRLLLNMSSYYIASFNFLGSNDGETWTTIGETYYATSSGSHTFEITNSTAYLYYKIETYVGYNSSRIDVYEVTLYEDTPVGNESKFKLSFYEYDYVPGGTLRHVTRDLKVVEMNTTYKKQLDINTGTMSNTQLKKGSIILGTVESTEVNLDG